MSAGWLPIFVAGLFNRKEPERVASTSQQLHDPLARYRNSESLAMQFEVGKPRDRRMTAEGLRELARLVEHEGYDITGMGENEYIGRFVVRLQRPFGL